MPGQITVVSMRAGVSKTSNMEVINCCSNSKEAWQTDLSPFKIGPCQLYAGHVSKNMENAWQFAKVYKEMADDKGYPTADYWRWAQDGWADEKAHRYPMGRGAKPLYSYWNGAKLGYIDARKEIYGPLYAAAVMKTAGYDHLVSLFESGKHLVLRDFDGYDHDKLGMTLTEVLNNPKRKCGHAFFLKMLITMDAALHQLKI